MLMTPNRVRALIVLPVAFAVCAFSDRSLQQQPTSDSALLVAIGAEPYTLTSEPDGVWFDINGDGIPDHVAWTKAGSDVAFLALDRNGDGVINDGTELFGNAMVPGVGNGFAALEALSKVQNGILSADNAPEFFKKLLLWTDRNHDGVSQPDEIEPFSKYFVGIGLGYGGSNRRDGFGNVYRWSGFVLAKGAKPLRDYVFEDYKAHTKTIYDVRFAIRQYRLPADAGEHAILPHLLATELGACALRTEPACGVTEPAAHHYRALSPFAAALD